MCYIWNHRFSVPRESAAFLTPQALRAVTSHGTSSHHLSGATLRSECYKFVFFLLPNLDDKLQLCNINFSVIFFSLIERIMRFQQSVPVEAASSVIDSGLYAGQLRDLIPTAVVFYFRSLMSWSLYKVFCMYILFCTQNLYSAVIKQFTKQMNVPTATAQWHKSSSPGDTVPASLGTTLWVHRVSLGQVT